MDTSPLNPDDHARLLGQILVNLQTLEFSIRAFLSNQVAASSSKNDPENNLHDLEEGDEVNETALTNYDSLGQLIDKYNRNVAGDFRVHRDALVYLRDGLVHGRISATCMAFPMRLLKFGRSSRGKVKVTHAMTMDREWFVAASERVFRAIKKVLRANQQRGFGGEIQAARAATYRPE